MTKQDLINQIESDKSLVEKYIQTFAHCDGRNGIDNILAPWAKNKGMLWHLLGRSLTKEVEVSLEMTEETLVNCFSELYGFQRESGQSYTGPSQFNPFIKEFHNFMKTVSVDKGSRSIWTIENLLTNVHTFCNNKVNIYEKKIEIEKLGKKLILSDGMKPMRALHKTINFFGREHFPHFSEFRLAHSNIMTTKSVTGTLTFSIHPLDYITMSDNANGWTSCLSWMEKGCYRRGALEMMNSNNVLMVYMKSKLPFVFLENDNKKWEWNNKSWRSMFYIDKDIILSGMPYPYEHEALTKAAIKTLRQLAYENLHWNYKYGIQRYLDMKTVFNEEMLENRQWGNPDKKNIYIYTKSMYNDILSDEENSKFWCIRNRPKRQKSISISGKAYCLDCGDPFDYEGNVEVETLICESCLHDHGCMLCGTYLHDNMHHNRAQGEIFCDDCYRNLQICPDCGDVAVRLRRYIILHTEEDLEKAKNNTFKNMYYWNELKKEMNGIEVYTCSHCYDKMLTKRKLQRLGGLFVGPVYYLNTVIPDGKFVEKRLLKNMPFATESAHERIRPLDLLEVWTEIPVIQI